MKYLLILIILAGFNLTGCTDDGTAARTKEGKATVFDGHLNALDKTRNIENVLQQSAAERQNNLDVE